MEYDLIDYESIRQDYTEYKIDNGLRLKVMMVIESIINEGDGDAKVGKITSFISSIVVAPHDFDASKLKEQTGPITNDDQKDELPFERIKEVINIYETAKYIILLGIKVIKIFGTTLKDSSGKPILQYEYKSSFRAIKKPVVGDSNGTQQPSDG